MEYYFSVPLKKTKFLLIVMQSLIVMQLCVVSIAVAATFV